jgi:hypothetical protein
MGPARRLLLEKEGIQETILFLPLPTIPAVAQILFIFWHARSGNGETGKLGKRVMS